MKKVRRILSWILAVVMICSMLPMTALADEENVAKIGDIEYVSLSAAISASKSGDTIDLINNAVLPTTNFPANKAITIRGNGFVIDAKEAHLNIMGDVSFENCTLNMYGVPKGNWMYIYMASNGKLTFNDAVVNIDGTEAADNTTVMYFPEPGTAPADVVIKNSTFVAKNCKGNGISWGGNTQPRKNKIDIENSSFTIENCAEKNASGGGGIIGTFDITILDSVVNVFGNKSYGSNGSNYTIINSKVNYADNGTHGLSATDLIIENSSVTAENNGYYGVYASREFKVDSTSVLTVAGNSSKGDCAGLKLTSGVTNGLVESGAKVVIKDNYCSGLSNNGKVVFEEGSDLTIMNNNNDKGDTSNGGGIYNSGADAVLTLPSDAKIYNNYAETAGDDIYNNTTSTITFGEVGSNWSLDECEHKINAWYLDTSESRWNVEVGGNEESDEKKYCSEHSSTEYFERYEVTGNAVHGLLALKAAHDKDLVTKGSMPGLEKYIVVNDTDEESTTVAAGDTINFKLVSNVPDDLTNYLEAERPATPTVATRAFNSDKNSGTYKLTFHDTMDSQLSLDESTIQLMIGERIISESSEDEDQYYTVSTSCDDGCTFEVSMDLVALYEAGFFAESDFGKAQIIVTYSAKADAEIPAGTYHNKANVEYESGDSEEDIVNIDTYAINIYKYDQAKDTKGLAGAKFELKDERGDIIATVTSGDNGYVRIDGLNIGKYTLTETEAPEGYVKSDVPLEVEITVDGDADNVINVKFANSPIPHTGGTGTRMYTIAGAAIVIGAGALLVVSRRKKED